MNKIELIADYHTHTFFSHGKGTVETNTYAAMERNLGAIGITDHGLGHIVRGLTKMEVKIARKAVDKLNARFGDDMRVLMGVEANIVSLDGTIDLPESMMDYFDIILVGYHPFIARAAHMSDLFKMYFWNLLPHKREGTLERNTLAYIRAMEKYKIDMISHPGLVLPIDIPLIAEAAAANGTVLEINCKHEALSAEQVRLAMPSGVMFAISSDAHSPAAVGVFDNGLRIAAEAELPAERIVNSSLGAGFRMRNGFKY